MGMVTFDQALNILEQITDFKPQKRGGVYMARCPVHKDDDPSLAVSEGRSADLVLHCLAGCTFREIIGAISSQTCYYDPSDLIPQNELHHLPPWERPIRNEFSYYNEDGKLVAQKVRFDDAEKDFAIRRPAPKRHYFDWIWNTAGVDFPPYNLPKILKSPVVAIVEGEKDADNLTRRGLPATCNIDGGSRGKPKWHHRYNKYLYGKHVLILADHDSTGVAHARMIMDSINPSIVRSKTLVHPLPGLTLKMDISDWFSLGRTIDDLLKEWSRASGIPIEILSTSLDKH